MEQKSIVQRIRKRYDSQIEVGMKYYAIISALNNLKFTKRELQILAFTATRGTISSGSARESFYQLFGSSRASLSNMIGRMEEQGYLVRVDNRITVHPSLAINFDFPLSLKIILTSE